MFSLLVQRWTSSTSGAGAVAPGSALQRWLKSDVGPATIHFWAPAFKWALVIAGIRDIQRPVEKMSVSQNVALTATGLIWSRYAMVITPVNYSLMTVNLFLAGTGLYQLSRIYNHQQAIAKNKSI